MLEERGVPFEVIGLSYYPWWHGPATRLPETLRGLSAFRARRRDRRDRVAAWTTSWYDDTHNVVGSCPTARAPRRSRRSRRSPRRSARSSRACPAAAGSACGGGSRRGSPRPARTRRGRTALFDEKGTYSRPRARSPGVRRAEATTARALSRAHDRKAGTPHRRPGPFVFRLRATTPRAPSRARPTRRRRASPSDGRPVSRARAASTFSSPRATAASHAVDRRVPFRHARSRRAPACTRSR